MRETGSPVPPSLSRGAHSGVSEPFVPLPGSCQWPLPCLLSVPFSKSGSFRRPAHPASSVHQACPPPCQPGLPLTGFRFARARCYAGLPVLHHSPSSAHADATTPVGAARCSCRLPSRTTNGLPLTPGGSAPTLPFSRPAQRSIQISACAVAELLNATLCHRSASNYVVTSIIRSGCYQPKRQLFGWASHPTRKTRLSTAH